MGGVDLPPSPFAAGLSRGENDVEWLTDPQIVSEKRNADGQPDTPPSLVPSRARFVQGFGRETPGILGNQPPGESIKRTWAPGWGPTADSSQASRVHMGMDRARMGRRRTQVERDFLTLDGQVISE
jgi:hypothetical protein